MSPFIFLITGTGLFLYFLMVISLILAAYFPAIMRFVNNRSTTSQSSQSRPTAARTVQKTSASQPAAAAAVHDDSASSDDSEVIGTDSGTVKWFNVKKGFGFITLENGDEIFVHFRSIRGSGHRHLKPGQEVKFNIVEGEKGPQAEDVSILSDD
jgi:CspA family cold shock protein